ncbi:MAG: hypothetical protein ABJD97_08930 [Betaproteobacteria bacterium]
MVSKPRNPHPETSSPISDLDLEAQIVRAELAVIARDRRIRHTSDALVRRVKRTALKNAGGGALLGLATVGLTWWLNRRRPAAPAPAPAAAPESESHSTYEHLLHDAALMLGGLLPVLWPLLPRHLRRNVTPGTASTVLAFFAPLVGRLFRRRPKAPPAS